MSSALIPLQSADESLVSQIFEPKNNIHNIIANSNDEFAKKEKKEELTAFITTDGELLRQYYDMRHTAFHDEIGFSEYSGWENECDRKGHIIVAVKGGNVVGGVRLMFSDEAGFMSNEIPGTEFCYDPIIKKYDQRDGLINSEISSVVVSPDERDGSVSRKLFEVSLKEIRNHKCHYLCGVAMVAVCREYRRKFKELGLDIEIMMNRLWEKKSVYNFVKLFPMYVKLS